MACFDFRLARDQALAGDIVQAGARPVTVSLLGHHRVGAAASIEADGLSAVVLPAPHGSIAVVGRRVADMDEVARKVFEDVGWEA
jgi:hypothetical protein